MTAYSYCSANDPRVHVGLGAASGVDAVTVLWPDSAAERFGPLAAGAEHVLTQGTGTRVE